MLWWEKRGSFFSRTIVVNNNIDDQGARASSIQILPTNLNVYNLEKIKGFCPQSCYLRSNLTFVMQLSAPD